MTIATLTPTVESFDDLIADRHSGRPDAYVEWGRSQWRWSDPRFFDRALRFPVGNNSSLIARAVEDVGFCLSRPPHCYLCDVCRALWIGGLRFGFTFHWLCSLPSSLRRTGQSILPWRAFFFLREVILRPCLTGLLARDLIAGHTYSSYITHTARISRRCIDSVALHSVVDLEYILDPLTKGLEKMYVFACILCQCQCQHYQHNRLLLLMLS